MYVWILNKVISCPPCMELVEVKAIPGLFSKAFVDQMSPVESKKYLRGAAMDPKRVGDPIARPLQFIKSSFDKNVEKITVITGKGLRSKVDQNPYQSKDLSILKYSVPEFIRNNLELMSLIKKIDDRTENKNSGSFTIHLKSKNKL